MKPTGEALIWVAAIIVAFVAAFAVYSSGFPYPLPIGTLIGLAVVAATAWWQKRREK